jgi:hypothetical protein
MCFATLLARPAVSQSLGGNTISNAAASPVAYVYVGTSKGVDLYDAASDGKLTLVKGSPFQTRGLAIGSNGKYFISLGTYYVHSYPVSSAGAIGKQVSTIDTQSYYGNGQCGSNNLGTIGLANLNHTGQNLYVLFPNENGNCDAAIQTYNISKSGDLTFDGGIMTGTNAGSGLFQAPSIIGNDTFAYAAGDFGCCGLPPGWSGYKTASNGEMQNWAYNLSAPNGYVPFYVTADPTNHLAAIVAYNYGEDSYDPAQLASYTVDSMGNLSTTSTAENMPYPQVNPSILNMSPSGKLLAVGGYGLQVFHFNGAEPITPYSSVLTTAVINQLHWDNDNHLYALSEAQTSSALTWSATDATQVKITGSDGSSYAIGDCTGGCFGYRTVNPTETTTYTIIGTKVGGGTVFAAATVTVHSDPADRKALSGSVGNSGATVSITASPTSINTFSQLFVYSVTPTSITAAPGSPYALPDPGVNALIVVPKL